MIDSNENIIDSTTTKKIKKSEKLFDKMFGNKKSTSTNKKEIITENGKIVITAPEGSIEYWNEIRKKIGMKPLK